MTQPQKGELGGAPECHEMLLRAKYKEEVLKKHLT